MSRVIEPKKTVVINTSGVIKELGCITGPVVHPCRLEISKIVQMITNGYNMDEIDPKNPSRRVHLTLENVRSNNFAPKPQVNEEKKSSAPAQKDYTKAYMNPGKEQKSVSQRVVEEKQPTPSVKIDADKQEKDALDVKETKVPTSDFKKK